MLVQRCVKLTLENFFYVINLERLINALFLLINNFTTGNTYTFTIIFLLQVLKRMREIIGFSEGDSILAPGGSISNMYGLLCARHRFFPDYKTKGTSAMDQSQIAIYTSAQVRKKK